MELAAPRTQEVMVLPPGKSNMRWLTRSMAFSSINHVPAYFRRLISLQIATCIFPLTCQRDVSLLSPATLCAIDSNRIVILWCPSPATAAEDNAVKCIKPNLNQRRPYAVFPRLCSVMFPSLVSLLRFVNCHCPLDVLQAGLVPIRIHQDSRPPPSVHVLLLEFGSS